MRVWVFFLRYRVQGLGLRVEGCGCRVVGFELRGSRLGVGVKGLGSRV